MKRKYAIALAMVLFFLVGGCSTTDPGSAESVELMVTNGTESARFSVADLEGLPSAETSFQGETYLGVPLLTLLGEAGFDVNAITEVEAIAQDGFSATYTPDLFQMADTLVAYATTDGPMVGDDGVFRMVLPDQAGKLNVRQLVELHVAP